MRLGLSLGPAGERSAVTRAMLDRARRDRTIAVLDRDRLGHWLVFSPTEEVAQAQLRSFEAQGAVSPSLALLEIDEDGTRARLDATEASRERLAAFVTWMLEAFAPCRVFDAETGEDLTELASRGLDALFR
jgi:hypothetical protein